MENPKQTTSESDILLFGDNNKGGNGIVIITYVVASRDDIHATGGKINTMVSVDSKIMRNHSFKENEVFEVVQETGTFDIAYLCVGGGAGANGRLSGANGKVIVGSATLNKGKYEIRVGEGGLPYHTGGNSEIVGISEIALGGQHTPRYHGFTCPNCGSHKFGTHKNSKFFNNNDFPTDARIGTCSEYLHSNVVCSFKWNRDDPAQEATAMYFQSKEEYMATFDFLNKN